ncbi:MAG: septum formation initiator family protein [Candidatus Paceibacterota bacterium]
MAENFQAEKRRQGWFYLLLFFLIVLNIFLVRGVWRVYQKSRLAGDNYLSAKERLDILTARQKVLTDRLESLKTERGLEEQIRNNFPVVKPGEKVVVIVDSPTTTATTTETGNPLWRAIKSIFFNK